MNRDVLVGNVPGNTALHAFLQAYGVEKSTEAEPNMMSVVAGTYRLRTTQGMHLICLMTPEEKLSAHNVARLLDCLYAAGIPCPLPRIKRDGECSGMLGEYPALLLHDLPGEPLSYWSTAQCAAVGELLARLHLIAGLHEATRTACARLEAAETLALSQEDARLIEDEVRYQSLYRLDDLPRGLMHGAATRDSILFEAGHLSGILGLENARSDFCLLDLAVSVTDSCEQPGASLDESRVLAFLEGYHKIRPLRAIERGAWPVVLRAAALNRWIKAIKDENLLKENETAARNRFLNRIMSENELQRLWP